MDFHSLRSYFTDVKESDLKFGGGMVPSQWILSAPARTSLLAPEVNYSDPSVISAINGALFSIAYERKEKLPVPL